jgi:hypothetical protein
MRVKHYLYPLLSIKRHTVSNLTFPGFFFDGSNIALFLKHNSKLSSYMVMYQHCLRIFIVAVSYRFNEQGD